MLNTFLYVFQCHLKKRSLRKVGGGITAKESDQSVIPRSPIRFPMLHVTFGAIANNDITHWLPRDNQRDREQQTLLKSPSSYREKIPVWEQLATDQLVVPRQVFTSYSRLLISTAFTAVSRVGCLGAAGVYQRHRCVCMGRGIGERRGGRWRCWYIRNFVDLTNFNICTHIHVFANIDG